MGLQWSTQYKSLKGKKRDTLAKPSIQSFCVFHRTCQREDTQSFVVFYFRGVYACVPEFSQCYLLTRQSGYTSFLPQPWQDGRQEQEDYLEVQHQASQLAKL